eukprot:scaffold14520_cov109-Isochrysis_galbana.AAC.5
MPASHRRLPPAVVVGAASTALRCRVAARTRKARPSCASSPCCVATQPEVPRSPAPWHTRTRELAGHPRRAAAAGCSQAIAGPDVDRAGSFLASQAGSPASTSRSAAHSSAQGRSRPVTEAFVGSVTASPVSQK